VTPEPTVTHAKHALTNRQSFDQGTTVHVLLGPMRRGVSGLLDVPLVRSSAMVQTGLL